MKKLELLLSVNTYSIAINQKKSVNSSQLVTIKLKEKLLPIYNNRQTDSTLRYPISSQTFDNSLLKYLDGRNK